MENKQFQSPVYHVIAVPYEKIIPNTYNPNKVAPPEMKLLYDSIKADGFTMPIAVSYTHLDVYKRQGLHNALSYRGQQRLPPKLCHLLD